MGEKKGDRGAGEKMSGREIFPVSSKGIAVFMF